jgi:FlhB HrpN YscU SpaS Family/FHIPEP family
VPEDDKTEKATEHRRHKAHEEGQVARSRELSATAAMLAAVFVLISQAPATLLLWRQFFRAVLDQAASHELSIATPLFPWSAQLLLEWPWKPLAAAWGIPFRDALKTYTVLTVGDGLVTMIPSLLVSIAGGFSARSTRASSCADCSIRFFPKSPSSRMAKFLRSLRCTPSGALTPDHNERSNEVCYEENAT